MTDVGKLNAGGKADHRSSQDSPGALRGEAWITLQTRQAQRLVAGRRQEGDQPAIIGLTRFGAMVGVIGQLARLDDPYADWWLVRIEETLDEAQSELNTLRQSVEARLREVPGIEVKIAESLEPVRIPLKFTDTYAYRAARLITDYDTLVRSVLTARHVGFLTRDEAERLLHLGGKAVRRSLSSCVGFKNQSVSREDLRQGTARARQAEEVMGTVPDDILSGERRARHAPQLQRLGRKSAKDMFVGPLSSPFFAKTKNPMELEREPAP